MFEPRIDLGIFASDEMPDIRRSFEARLSRDVLGEREHLIEDVRARGAVDVHALVREEAVDALGGRPKAEADLPRRR